MKNDYIKLLFSIAYKKFSIYECNEFYAYTDFTGLMRYLIDRSEFYAMDNSERYSFIFESIKNSQFYIDSDITIKFSR